MQRQSEETTFQGVLFERIRVDWAMSRFFFAFVVSLLMQYTVAVVVKLFLVLVFYQLFKPPFLFKHNLLFISFHNIHSRGDMVS